MNLRLFDKLPESVTVGRKTFKCDFDFRNVLKMLDIMQREDIYPDARDFLCVKCVIPYKTPRKNVREVYDALCAVLFEKTAETGAKRLTSYEQDAGMIRAAFRQVYHIDLFRDRVHWLEFGELVANLPEGNRFTETVGIRARPMPTPTKYNAKEREWLLKAKQACALHLNEREREKKYDKDVSNVFAGLMSFMQKTKEVNKDGG